MIIDDFFVKLLSVDFFSLSFIKELLISSSEPASSKVGFNSSKFIKTNTNKTNNYKPENKIISDTCEAIIGAIFLDQGIKVVENFILKIWNEYIENTQETKIDSKTMLQEFSLKKYKVLPKYTLLKTKGPKHKPVFHVQVKIKSSKSIDGIGSSKKLAEQDAATSLLRKMNLL